MCYTIAIHHTREELENRFHINKGIAFHEPNYHVPAFVLPEVTVITSGNPGKFSKLQWGLIPFWTKDEKTAGEIRTKTFNARGETITTKASYKNAIKQQRCLVPVKGFYEWHTRDKKKYPYYIKARDNEIICLAGLYDKWVNKNTGEEHGTFTIITTKASPMLEKIHNSKKRMPVILHREEEGKWIDKNTGVEEATALLKAFEDEKLDAHPISKLITARGKEKNTPEIIQPHDHGIDLLD
jgi:putative SOS response-associated peptidase YedK